MWYSSSFKFLLTLLNVTGLLPFQIKMENGRIIYVSKPKLQIIQIAIYLILFSSSQAYICYEKILHHPVVNELIFVFCTFTIFLVYGVLSLTNAIHAAKIKRFFRKFTRIELKIKEINLNNHLSRNTFNDMIILEVAYLITISIYLFLIYFYNYDLKYSVLFTLGFTVPKIVIIGHSFLYVNCFLFIHQYYSIFNRELEGNTFKRASLSKLIKIQNDFATLIRSLSYYYDRQNLFVVFIYIVWISYEIYHLVLLVIQEKIAGFDKVLVLFATSWILVQFSALLVMVIMYTMTFYERKKFIPLLINYAVVNQITDEVD